MEAISGRSAIANSKAEVFARLTEEACAAGSPARIARACAALREAALDECAQGALTLDESRAICRSIDAAEARALRDPSPEDARAAGGDAVLLDVSLTKETREETSRFREHFVGVVGHDLRNPLTAILTSAQLLLRYGGLDAPQARVANRIAASAGRMARMIEDLLDFARTRLGGGFPIRTRRIDLGELTASTVEELIFAHPTRAVHIDSQGDLWGNWDAGRMEQVISNLVSNALQHGPPDGEVTLTLRGEPNVVVLTTHNGGAPIPPEILPYVFEPGRRGDALSGGLGLGLFIVEQIVLAHDGSIEARSSEGDGTTFTIVLPRKARGSL